jgi:perosamine synthetase
MPMYSSSFHSQPMAESLGWRGINLPSYPDLDESSVQEICLAIKAHFDLAVGSAKEKGRAAQ